MRHVVFAVLVAVPSIVITWIFARGATPPPLEQVCIGGSTVVATGTEPPGVAIARSATAQQAGALTEHFARPLAGATVSGSVESYDAKGLFEYINGGAPAYIERNFQTLAAAEMTSHNGGELTCDIYDMGTPEDATAIYDFEKRPATKEIEIGAAGRTGDMSLAFRRGRYYVKFTAFDPKAEEALADIARALDGRLS